MAYPVVSAPYGFKPINLIGGQVFAGSTRQIPIASSASALNNGDIVKFAGGTLVPTALTYNSTSYDAGTVGVFLGCSYTSPATGQKLFSNSLPASTVANDIVAYVEDDPDAVFQAVIVPYSTTTSYTPYAVSQAYVGTNVFVNSTNVGNSPAGVVPANGVSGQAVQLASGNTRLASTAPFRIVGLNTDTGVYVTTQATTATSTSVTVPNTTGITVGMQVYGPGILQGAYTYITAISGTTVTISAASTSSVTLGNFTFFGCPEVKVKFNFGYHSYYAAAGV